MTDENSQRKNQEAHKKYCTDPVLSNAPTAAKFSPFANLHDVTANDFAEGMLAERKKIKAGDLSRIDDMLMTQAITLDSLFNKMVALSADNINDLTAFERLFKLGLKAQAQTTNALRVLSEHKQPRSVVMAKQANIANNQQVNNAQMDTGSAGETVSANQEGKALDKIDGAEIESGKITCITERQKARAL